MYSKMLRQFSKGSLISISSEPSKIHLLIKVLYRHIWFNLCRRYFLFHALNVSLCYHSSSATLVLVLRSLDMKYFNFANLSVRGNSHIKSSHSFHENDAKFQTHPPSSLHIKMQNLPKIDDYNFKYKTCTHFGKL